MRFRLRFGLWALCLAVAVIALPCAYYARKWQGERRDRELAQRRWHADKAWVLSRQLTKTYGGVLRQRRHVREHGSACEICSGREKLHIMSPADEAELKARLDRLAWHTQMAGPAAMQQIEAKYDTGKD